MSLRNRIERLERENTPPPRRGAVVIVTENLVVDGDKKRATLEAYRRQHPDCHDIEVLIVGSEQDKRNVERVMAGERT